MVGDWALPESEWKDGATWPSDGDGRPDWSLEVGAGLGACCEETGVYEETRRVPWMSLRELCQWTRSLAGQTAAATHQASELVCRGACDSSQV